MPIILPGRAPGGHSRKVSTQSPEAQTWFDRGLNWCFGFHQEEGVRCFQRALDDDPTCVMAHWGVAYGCGPFYNLAWRGIPKVADMSLWYDYCPGAIH